MKEKNLMLSGKLYKAADDELKQDFLYAKKITRQINLTAEDESEKRQLLFKQLFKSTGKKFYIEPPFHCDYGKNISIGENFYANYDCIIIDVCNVNIGNNVFLAPRVCIYTAAHPLFSRRFTITGQTFTTLFGKRTLPYHWRGFDGQDPSRRIDRV